MGDYNFANLSSYDFELFMRDLLNASEDLKLRAFAPGRDRGIDLRGWRSGRRGPLVIVQCKHMMGSRYPSLLSSVKKEKAKLDQLSLRPDRYILATTKLLTEVNIDELAAELFPYCISSVDVMDIQSIEQLLAEHENVLRRHYKLWITSTPVLQRIIHAGTYNSSEFYTDKLLSKSRTFVQPEAFAEARDILKENHVCIISGLPGVGKTTLADMLCLEYLADGFEPVVISRDVMEGNKVFSRDRKQIFIYDDFLDRSSLHEKLHKNEDALLFEFIDRVSATPNHRFILTTREYVLRGARARYPRLDADRIGHLNCVLEMTGYSELQKGRILYQHVAFADGIPREDIEDLVSRRRYIEIVRHRNYTPRHISDALEVLALRRGRTASPRPLADSLLDVLNDPAGMWRHALHELSYDSQRLFLTLAMFPVPVTVEDLRTAYASQDAHRPERFAACLQTIDDSFVSIDGSPISGGTVDFRNPSLQEFAVTYVDDNPEWLDVLLGNPRFFEQIRHLFTLADARTRFPEGPAEIGEGLRKAEEEGSYPPKHPEVKRWVEREGGRLAEIAFRIFVSEGDQIDTYFGVLRLRDFLDILAASGMPDIVESSESTHQIVRRALNPQRRDLARIMTGILDTIPYRNLLDRILARRGHEIGAPEDAASYMRRRMLERISALPEDDIDQRRWVFDILSRVDEVLDLEIQDSLDAWGHAYPDLARRIVERLRVHGTADHEDLARIFSEIQEIGDVLGLYLRGEMAEIEDMLDKLHENNSRDIDFSEHYDDERDRRTAKRADPSKELDGIFRSLLS